MGTYEIPIFHPTMEDMKDLMGYVFKQMVPQDPMEKIPHGIVKIVPPKRFRDKLIADFCKDQNLLNQKVPVLDQSFEKKKKGVFVVSSTTREEKQTLREYMKTSCASEVQYENLTLKELEQKFFALLEEGQLNDVQYAADLECETVDNSADDFFDLDELPSLLDDVPSAQIPGIRRKFIYYGAFGSVFAFHFEDGKLISINVHRGGKVKIWYGIHPDDVDKFLLHIEKKYHPESKVCKGYLMHKRCFISPRELEKANIRYGRIEQSGGEIVLTFPNGIHGGFNTGFNCNYARNLAPHFWLPYAKTALQHSCAPDGRVGFSFSNAFINSLMVFAQRNLETRISKVPGGVVHAKVCLAEQEPEAVEPSLCSECHLNPVDHRNRDVTKRTNGPVCGSCSMKPYIRNCCYECGTRVTKKRRRNYLGAPPGTEPHRRFLCENHKNKE